MKNVTLVFVVGLFAVVGLGLLAEDLQGGGAQGPPAPADQGPPAGPDGGRGGSLRKSAR